MKGFYMGLYSQLTLKCDMAA